MDCPQNTSVITDNTPLECDGYISTKCVVHPTSIAFLSLPANSTQYDINNAYTNTFINYNSRINLLENGGFTYRNQDIDGTYNLQSGDNKKIILVNSVLNTPLIALNAALPDGFECQVINNTVYDDNVSDSAFLSIATNYVTTPYFTVPLKFGVEQSRIANYGTVTIKKHTANLYTVSGDLYDQGS